MIRNLTRDAPLAERTVEAKRSFSRMRGMLGRRFTDFDAMVFFRNNSVHTFFMSMPIDVIFTDPDGKIVSAARTLKPWRIAGASSAKTTIELPAGTLERTETAVGDQLEITIDAAM